MLREIASRLLQKQPSGLVEHWFVGDRCDLFVWTGQNHEVEKFQLCYRLGGHGEEAIVWDRRDGLRHTAVDDGEDAGDPKRTPLLVANGPWSPPEALDLLRREARDATVPGDLLKAVTGVLEGVQLGAVRVG